MPAVEFDRGPGGVQPLLGPLCPEVVVRRPGDELGQAGLPCLDQLVRVGVSPQHGEIRHREVAGERGHRHDLADEVLDAHLVLRGETGEPVGGPDPPVQGRPLGARQPQRPEAVRIDERDVGQRVGIDPVGLRMARQEASEIRGLVLVFWKVICSSARICRRRSFEIDDTTRRRTR
jgi:hypothetical protein